MLKMRAEAPDGSPVLIFALSWKNLEELKGGVSQQIFLSELGYESGMVVIYAGETDEQMLEAMKEMGVNLPPIQKPPHVCVMVNDRCSVCGDTE